MPHPAYHYPKCPDQAVFWIKQHISCPMIEAAEGKTDAIQLAAEVGRLDLVSMLLGFLALLIGAGSLLGFWMIRGAVLRKAEKEAKREINECAPELIAEELRKDPELWLKVIRQNPATFRSAIREAFKDLEDFEREINGNAADKIAEAIGEDEADDEPS